MNTSTNFYRQLDARVKILFTLAFVLAVSFTPTAAWPAYILFLAVILSAVLLSGLSLTYVFKRSLIALPFSLAALPLIFTGAGPLQMVEILEWSIPFSPAGSLRFASILIKAWLSVQAGVLLAGSIPAPVLLAALRSLGVPALMVTILNLMWRYLFVIGDEAARLMRARSSRSGAHTSTRKTGGSLFWRAGVTGQMAGSLFLRSIERSDRVYHAMLARGYNGEPIGARQPPLARSDRWTLIFIILILFMVMLFGLLTGV